MKYSEFHPSGSVTLIGMPGAGKSTVGVLLAKAMAREFIDTDLRIQADEGLKLHQLLEKLGPEGFLALEEQYILDLRCGKHIIATGGSAVYSSRAMAHLRKQGPVVYLQLPLADIQRRVDNLHARGVVMIPGQTLAQLYAERRPLYESYADITVACQGLSHEESLAAILHALNDYNSETVP